MIEPAKEYASALFELSQENASEKEFFDALVTVENAFSAFSDYEILLSSPNIPFSEREQLLEKAFRNEIPEYVLSFLKILCKNGRITLLSECVKEYEKLYQKTLLCSSARIISAEQLTDNEKSALIGKLEKITGNTVIAEYEIDKTILGGLIIRIDDKVLDGSIKNKIREVKDVTEK